jgi:tripartite-type tricarboxylate transporter receptor subunit TctC
MMKRSIFGLFGCARSATAPLVALMLVAAPGLSGAQPAFPQKAIRIVVPFTPGGGPDVLAREVAPKLQERLGQTVIVENRAGAGGNIGADFVVKSPPDGHTLVVTTAGLSAARWVTKNMPFDPHKDLTPVGVSATLPLVVAAAQGVPFKTVAELIAHAKANPGKLSYASSGVGTLQHLAMELFKDMTGTNIVHVPYKGAAGMLNDLLAGEVQVMFGALNSALPHIRSGRINAIALGDKNRNPVLDVPTVNETVPGFEAEFWFGWAVAAGTPAPIVDRLSRELRAIVELPEVSARLVAAGFDVRPSTPGEMKVRMQAESDRWERVVKKTGIQPE